MEEMHVGLVAGHVYRGKNVQKILQHKEIGVCRFPGRKRNNKISFDWIYMDEGRD